VPSATRANPETPLAPIMIADLSTGIAGAYCAKMLFDGGAQVVKVEPPAGDPLRRWSVTNAPIPSDDDGALFQFLAGGFASITVDPDDSSGREQLRRLLAAATIIIWSPGSPVAELPDLTPAQLHASYPDSVVVSLTPFGLSSPWTGKAASELTVQAWAGCIGDRGVMGEPPVSIGGRIGDWLTGLMGAVGALTSYRRAALGGGGDLVDVSMIETLAMMGSSMHPVTFQAMAGHPFRTHRTTNIPCIEPTSDGAVGFMVATGEQWQNFCLMVEQPDWMDDESLVKYAGREQRRDEIVSGIRAWTTRHTTAEVLELASALRIPAAPIGNGELTPTFEAFDDGSFYTRNPRGGFLQPQVPYRFYDGTCPQPPAPAPHLGENNNRVQEFCDAPAPPSANRVGAVPLPLAGIRVADFTAFWAGPIIGQYLAMLGAEVIHIESPRRPDGMRHHWTRPVSEPSWWEWAPMYQATNSSKHDFAVDMTTSAGRALACELISKCDIVIDNFTPRVMEGWGLNYDSIRRPDLIMLRAPAFGLTGPWRDRTGYAQTMEQVSGMAWVTGRPDGVPEQPNGPCDPIAGMHSVVALLLALERRRRTGKGMLVEVPMVASALNVAAEQVIEYSAYGNLVGRFGNRAPAAAPQNLYLCADLDDSGLRDRWVAVAITTDEQWRALRTVLGNPAWAADPSLDSASGRLAMHDLLDKQLAAWCSERHCDEIVDMLWGSDIPVGKVLLGYEQTEAAGLGDHSFETVAHPVTGEVPHLRFATRFDAGPARHHRRHAPLLGEHNEQIVVDLLGHSRDDFERLTADGVIGAGLQANPFARG
jgi:crotonobetainyl-CoA:carnitine CoA-transferase CaiB-like acyl-CoA transferase